MSRGRVHTTLAAVLAASLSLVPWGSSAYMVTQCVLSWLTMIEMKKVRMDSERMTIVSLNLASLCCASWQCYCLLQWSRRELQLASTTAFWARPETGCGWKPEPPSSTTPVTNPSTLCVSTTSIGMSFLKLQSHITYSYSL